jgi:hypothetical protein
VACTCSLSFNEIVLLLATQIISSKEKVRGSFLVVVTEAKRRWSRSLLTRSSTRADSFRYGRIDVLLHFAVRRHGGFLKMRFDVVVLTATMLIQLISAT